MKTSAIKLFLSLSFLLFSGSAVLHAQMSSSQEPLRPSADVWDAVKYGDISPSLYTGTVNVSIPFYSYKDADFEIPISFVYASNGLQPNARAGNMGMGWRLVAGGCISREIKGTPDDEYGIIDVGTGNYLTVRGFAYLSDSGLTPGSPYLYALGPLGPVDTQCFYTNSDRSIMVDAEPDIFHFDFMGYTGSFMLDTDGYVHVFDTNVNPNSIKVEYDISFNQDKCAFAITTGDAYRYEFDGQVGNTGLNHEYTIINNNPVILGWHLSRIIAPNGRTVTFTYNRGPFVTSFRPNTLTYTVNGDFWTGTPETRSSASKTQVQSGVYSADLATISIEGTTLASFTYASTTEKRYSNIAENSSLNVTGNNVLTGITISYGGVTLRSCNLSYSYSGNPGQRRFLSSVSISGEGTYSMAYESLSSVPMYGTFKIDHWDYYNARYNADASSFLNISTLSSDGMTETYNSGNVREPNFLPSKYGILTRITYPTGGYSSFTYEAHDYSKVQSRIPTYAFEPTVVTESGSAGGVRIKSVVNCSASGTVLSSKTYTYTKSGASSGILLNKPRYRANFSFQALNNYYYMTGTAYLRTNNLTRYNSTHIEYTDVTETSRDGSSTTYSFTSSEVYPDSIQSDETISLRSPGDYSAQYDLYWSLTANSPYLLFYLTSAQSQRGRLLSVLQKNAGGSSVASSTTSYLGLSEDDYTYVPVSSPADIEMIGVYTGRDEAVSHTSTQYFGSAAVTSTQEIEYNNFYQPSEITITDSRGVRIRTKKQYVTDNITGTYAIVYGCGIIDAPISEKVYEVDSSGNETLLSEKTWSYTRPAATAYPKLVRASAITVKDVRASKNLSVSYTYDNGGRLLQKKDAAGLYTCYVWGYGGLYPVAEIIGATLTQVKAVSGLSGISSSPLSGSIASYESGLRSISGAQVTTYEYSPLVGLTRITGPDGRSESYDYNSSGKLRHVLDDLLERVSAYYYSADLESSSVNSNN